MIVKHNDAFTNKRVANTKESTLGILYHNTSPIGFIIEDEPREKKVINETRIPAKSYKLKINYQETPLTLKYREKYAWFKNHIEIVGVENFTGVYIHIGNTEKDTAGCQVVGKLAAISEGEFINKESTALFQEFYLAVYPALVEGKTIYYNIIDNI